MRSNASPRMNVVKKEDKEATIRSFIEQDLALRRTASGPVGGCYLLMALSIDSPVARALASLASELETAGIGVQAVFARTGTGQPVKTEEATGLERVAILRHTPDVRLLDAHEQLILGPSSVWVGDCMRRDPAKRDAYECYADNSAETANWAKRSFEQVWNRAHPVRARSMASNSSHAVALDPAAAEALISMGDAVPSFGATRH